MTVPVKAVFSTSFESQGDAPLEIQYMPPGKHRINASRNGKPVELDVSIDAQAADKLNAFLKGELAKVEVGSEDRPYFDFNHEDREAAAWPTEFYWAGDDPVEGGVRAKIEWSGAGRKALSEKTFRRFSPTFIPDDQGRVVGSVTNMGGLVNRAAFKSIQPLFAKGERPSEAIHEAQQRGDGQRASVGPEGVTETGALRAMKEQPLFARESSDRIAEESHPMNELIDTLKDVGLVSASNANSDPAAVSAATLEVKSSVGRLRGKIQELETLNHTLEAKLAETEKSRLSSIVEGAVQAGRIAPADASSKAFWLGALQHDEPSASKALETLTINPVLAKVTEGQDEKIGALDKMAQQQKKLAEVQAANPTAPFETLFAKAQSESPQLFC